MSDGEHDILMTAAEVLNSDAGLCFIPLNIRWKICI